jgi:hypothetical protein
MTFDEYLRTQGIGPREQDQLNPDRRERLRAAYWSSQTPAPAPAPSAPAPSAPAPTASNSTSGPSAFDPQGQMEADYREDNPFASYSSLLGAHGFSTSTPQASAFHQWVNNEGWSGIENDYKANAAKDPWDAPAIYDWMEDLDRGPRVPRPRRGQSAAPPVNEFTRMTGIQTDGGLLDTLRLRYNSMTPQQRGVNSATGFKPSRWAVF